jgi:hypothetical protein
MRRAARCHPYDELFVNHPKRTAISFILMVPALAFAITPVDARNAARIGAGARDLFFRATTRARASVAVENMALCACAVRVHTVIAGASTGGDGHVAGWTEQT